MWLMTSTSGWNFEFSIFNFQFSMTVSRTALLSPDLSSLGGRRGRNDDQQRRDRSESARSHFVALCRISRKFDKVNDKVGDKVAAGDRRYLRPCSLSYSYSFSLPRSHQAQ